MKKIKFLIASLMSAIALVFACVVGTRVHAQVEDGTYYALASDFLADSWDKSSTKKIQDLFTISGSFSDDSGTLKKDKKYDLTTVPTYKDPTKNYTSS